MCAQSQYWISAADLAEVVFPHGREGFYVVLGLYADDSHDQKMREIISAGALIGWPSMIFDAECRWQKRLDRDGIKYFRAYDCEHLSGEFDVYKHGWSLNVGSTIASAVRKDLVQIISSKDGGAGIGVSFLLNDFQNVIASNVSAREYWGTDPTIAVYKLLITTVLQLLDIDWPASRGLPIAFTFDDHAKWKEAEEAYQQLRDSDPLGDRMGYVGHADDRRHPPLQMADLIAYEARLRTLEWRAKKEPQRETFRTLAANNGLYYISLATREGLLSLRPVPELSGV
jgi:hypothetical protein